MLFRFENNIYLSQLLTNPTKKGNDRVSYRLNRGNLLTASFALCFSLFMTMQAEANVMFQASSATLSGGVLASGDLADTHNQNGLLSGYTSGVTDFNSYLAGLPLHTSVFANAEFLAAGTPPITVTYDLGQAIDLTGIAFWNEDDIGVFTFNVLTSTDGTNFTTFQNGLTPSDNPTGQNYGPDVYSFASIDDTTHVRFELFGVSINVALGEIAFGGTASTTTPPGGVVPEPTSFATWGLLVGAVAAVRRRRK